MFVSAWAKFSSNALSFLEGRNTAVFFVRDLFEKCYGSFNETVRFDFRNLIIHK